MLNIDLDFDNPPESPFALFEAWLAEAQEKEINDPTAMALASVDATHMPNVRMVLLKEYGADGFTFYTNIDSQKGNELAVTAKAAAVLHWKSCRRQIRLRGSVTRVSDAQADAYYNSRHPESRLGAWASDQSRPLEHRDKLLERFVAAKEKYGAENIPRPAYWSGFCLVPAYIEFWQDGAHRLHDRIAYARAPDDTDWTVERLYP